MEVRDLRLIFDEIQEYAVSESRVELRGGWMRHMEIHYFSTSIYKELCLGETWSTRLPHPFEIEGTPLSSTGIPRLSDAQHRTGRTCAHPSGATVVSIVVLCRVNGVANGPSSSVCAGWDMYGSLAGGLVCIGYSGCVEEVRAS